MSVNKVILIGNLGKDPDVKTVGTDKVANFSLATSEKYKDKSGQKVENTEWHNIVLWRRLAELAEQYLTKGSQIYLEGKIKTRSWEDKDGNKRYTTEIQGYEMQFLGGKGDKNKPDSAPITTPPASTEPAKWETPAVESDENDLPF